MKGLVLLILMSLMSLTCAFLVGCSQLENPQVLASVLTGPDIEENPDNDTAINETVGRVGIKAGHLKFGYQSHYFEGHGPDSAHGLFIAQDLVADPNGAGLLGKPYIGGFGTFNNDEIMYGPYIGTEYIIQGIKFNTEFQIRSFDRALEVLDREDVDKYRVVAGPVFYFPLE